MAYNRPNIVSGVTRATKAFFDNLLDGIDEGIAGDGTVELGYAGSSAQQVVTSGDPTALDGCAITFATTDRPALVVARIPLLYAGGDVTGVIEISDGTNVRSSVMTVRGNYGCGEVAMRVPAGTASRTYTMRAWRAVGSANLEITPENPPSVRSIQAIEV
ncbi:hypothetical protein J1765_gp24 [Gordonia phage Gaea]|uniref:Uncharacterized protein n=3 Tax=Kroosvirus TaxID=2948789 RepID=A0A7G8LM74_9CAUD|nr:hypothetical protein J1761_gp25 [Gordonia phage Kroos]YP_010001734.1 hypothetical protein J1763_gp25 [Gordonia phage YorkOnyx]YP_010001902.1 hypothetical protein J1765_gp24 [Gordonia phage Gaea]URP21092.1 hypothetical protein SEA_FLATWOODS_25 [Gordonia phage Flatwoods]WMI33034.1 hypothetical protein SEA_SCHOTTB_23 [Gordonia Phage SchottB]AYR02832.1 hypothetical protein SEA_GAEA_24 [Gordonia phage Gaea]AYR03004.1 hypothetical protein SEA_KROOS_25 [Gordonia phage Kroos]QNJ58346.1 hypothetic